MTKLITYIIITFISINIYCQNLKYTGDNNKETIDFINTTLKYLKKRTITDSTYYAPGFILKDGEKKFCEFYLLNPFETVYVIAKFFNDSIRVYSAKEIEGYQTIYDTYISYNSPTQNYFFNIVENGRILLLERGSLPNDNSYFYYIKLREQDYFYKIKLSQSSNFSNNINEISELFNYENKNFKLNSINSDKVEEFLLTLPDMCEILKNKILTRFYTSNDIRTIIKEYNECNSTKDIVKIKPYKISESSYKDSVKIYSKYRLNLALDSAWNLDSTYKYHKISFGFYLGYGLSQLKIRNSKWTQSGVNFNDSLTSIDINKKESAHLGIIYNYRISKRLLLRLQAEFFTSENELIYNRKDNKKDTIKISITSFGLPIYLVYRFIDKKSSPTIYFGPTIKNIMYSRSEKYSFKMKEYDLSFDFGLGFDKAIKYYWINPELRYTVGLININDKTNKSLYNQTIDKILIHSISLILNFH